MVFTAMLGKSRMGKLVTVYVDVLFVTNLVMDFIIMWAAARLAGIRPLFWRMGVAAGLGAVYGVGIVFPELEVWYSLPIKLIFSLLLVIFAYWPRDWNQLTKLCMFFYLTNFATAGAVIGSSYLFSGMPSEVYPDFSYLTLGSGVACAVALGSYGDRLLKNKVFPELFGCKVKVRFGKDWCVGQGFIDTGHQLVDPLTNKPVVIAEYSFIRSCLPEDVRKAVDNHDQKGDLFELLAATSWANRLRLVPFTAVGKKHGLLVALRSDEMTILYQDKSYVYSGVLVGLHLSPLRTDGGFQILLPAKVLEL